MWLTKKKMVLLLVVFIVIQIALILANNFTCNIIIMSLLQGALIGLFSGVLVRFYNVQKKLIKNEKED